MNLSCKGCNKEIILIGLELIFNDFFPYREQDGSIV